MRSAIKSLLIFGVFSAALSSCVVSKKKFDELLKAKTQLDQDKYRCDTSLSGLQKRFKALTGVHNLTKQDTAVLGTALRKLGTQYNQLDEQWKSLDKKHKGLEKDYNKLLTNSASEAAALSKDLQKKERELADLERSMNQTKLDNQSLAESLRKREERVKELEKILEDKDKATKALLSKVQKALLSFKEKDLTVNVKNGKVYVSLSEQLLFKSGSYAVDPKGLEALKKLSPVLKEDEDIQVMVEGHTDDVPFNSSNPALKDNWDLSVLRATAIVRALTVEGVPGKQLVSAGRSEYVPLEVGKTPEARQKNRRTEIILTPKLDELFQILGN